MIYLLQYWDARTFKWMFTGISVNADSRKEAFMKAREHSHWSFWQWENVRIIEKATP